MTIDSGQNITFNASYPVPNVDQSSQQFRDNFLITKVAIENLQNAATTNASILSISTSMAGQAVQLNVGYKNNALVLPVGNPSPNSPSTGMIRYNSGAVEFYAGGQWNIVVFAAGGVVTVPSLVVTTKATVPLAVASTDATQYSQLQTEIAARLAGDAQLISDLANTNLIVDDLVANAGAVDSLANIVGDFGNLLNQERADRIANDALLAADIANTNANVVILTSTVDGVYDHANAAFDAANAAANNTGFAQAAYDQANTALSTASGKVSKTGDAMTGALSVTSSFYVNDITANSSIYCSGQITAFSDEALKYNITTISDALETVKKIRGTTFNRADLADNPRQLGVIAQEIQKIVPEVVEEHPTNGLLSVAYPNLVALLVEAVKELAAEVDALKAR